MEFDYAVVITFVDTPGFEHPLEVREWFQAHEHDSGPLAEAFCAAHACDARFALECELLKPLAQGAAVIYVVDGSQPVRETDRAQMEVVRLATPSDRPRVAVINSRAESATYLAEWHHALSKTFNIVRVFNAHHAGFDERLNLLRSIRGVIPEWEPFLDRAITAFRDDWARRLEKSAEAICELLRTALRCSATETLLPGIDDRDAAQRVEQRLRDALRDEEDRFRRKICGYFRHTRGGVVPEVLHIQHLFSEEVVRVFGLSKHQLALTSATLSASLAAVGDLALGGAFLGALAGSGFLAGGVAGYWSARRLVLVEVPRPLRLWLPGKFAAHGRCVRARPGPLSNLPWLLLGRALEFVHWSCTWPHGKTGHAQSRPQISEHWNPQTWNNEEKAIAVQFIALASAVNAPRPKAWLRLLRRTSDPDTIEKRFKTMLAVGLRKTAGL